MSSEERARECAQSVERDLNGRSGFDLGGLDDDIREDITDAWLTILLAFARSERKRVLEDACRQVCSYCGGRALPLDHATHRAHGPNDASNWWHDVSPNRTALCDATPIRWMLRALAKREED